MSSSSSSSSPAAGSATSGRGSLNHNKRRRVWNNDSDADQDEDDDAGHEKRNATAIATDAIIMTVSVVPGAELLLWITKTINSDRVKRSRRKRRR